MKQTANIRRKRNAPLRTKSPLKRETPLERRTPVKKRRSGKRKGPPRDRKFLAFVRSQPCMVAGCTAIAEAHHFGKRGKSQRCSDYETVPLCHVHHLHGWHSSKGLPGGTREEWRERFRERAAELVALYEGRDPDTF